MGEISLKINQYIGLLQLALKTSRLDAEGAQDHRVRAAAHGSRGRRFSSQVRRGTGKAFRQEAMRRAFSLAAPSYYLKSEPPLHSTGKISLRI